MYLLTSKTVKDGHSTLSQVGCRDVWQSLRLKKGDSRGFDLCSSFESEAWSNGFPRSVCSWIRSNLKAKSWDVQDTWKHMEKHITYLGTNLEQALARTFMKKRLFLLIEALTVFRFSTLKHATHRGNTHTHSLTKWSNNHATTKRHHHNHSHNCTLTNPLTLCVIHRNSTLCKLQLNWF